MGRVIPGRIFKKRLFNFCWGSGAKNSSYNKTPTISLYTARVGISGQYLKGAGNGENSKLNTELRTTLYAAY